MRGTEQEASYSHRGLGHVKQYVKEGRIRTKTLMGAVSVTLFSAASWVFQVFTKVTQVHVHSHTTKYMRVHKTPVLWEY